MVNLNFLSIEGQEGVSFCILVKKWKSCGVGKRIHLSKLASWQGKVSFPPSPLIGIVWEGFFFQKRSRLPKPVKSVQSDLAETNVPKQASQKARGKKKFSLQLIWGEGVVVELLLLHYMG